MPLYDIRHKSTGEIKEVFIKIDDREQYFKDNPEWEQAVSQFLFGDLVSLGRQRPPEDFQNLLRKVRKENPGSNINCW